MSGWRVIEIILEAKSPLHIGERKMGMVDLTRRWIPGKNFWGAITAIGAKSLMKAYSPEVYQVVGNYLKDSVIFTPFYPYDVKSRTTFIPFYGQGSLEYIRVEQGKDVFTTISEYEFDLVYIESYTSTALDYSTYTAAEGMLHELEYIKRGAGFRGYVICRDGLKVGDDPQFKRLNIDLSLLNRGIADLVIEWFSELGFQGVGGDRTRGFGNLKLLNGKPIGGVNYLFIDKQEFKINGQQEMKIRNWNWSWKDKVFATVGKKDSRTFALIPLLVTDTSERIGVNLNHYAINNFAGDIEPVVGREWSNERGAGQKLGNVEFQMVPGSTFVVNNLEVGIDYSGRAFSYK